LQRWEYEDSTHNQRCAQPRWTFSVSSGMELDEVMASRRQAALRKELPRQRDSRGVEKITSKFVDSWRPDPRPVSRGRGGHDNNRAQEHGRLSYDDYHSPKVKTEPGLQTPTMPRKIAIPTCPRGLASRTENSKASPSHRPDAESIVELIRSVTHPGTGPSSQPQPASKSKSHFPTAASAAHGTT
jgi:hypothetical protein